MSRLCNACFFIGCFPKPIVRSQHIKQVSRGSCWLLIALWHSCALIRFTQTRETPKNGWINWRNHTRIHLAKRFEQQGRWTGEIKLQGDSTAFCPHLWDTSKRRWKRKLRAVLLNNSLSSCIFSRPQIISGKTKGRFVLYCIFTPRGRPTQSQQSNSLTFRIFWLTSDLLQCHNTEKNKWTLIPKQYYDTL